MENRFLENFMRFFNWNEMEVRRVCEQHLVRSERIRANYVWAKKFVHTCVLFVTDSFKWLISIWWGSIELSLLFVNFMINILGRISNKNCMAFIVLSVQGYVNFSVRWNGAMKIKANHYSGPTRIGRFEVFCWFTLEASSSILMPMFGCGF